MDPVRDTTLVDRTPIDYLDFASPASGLSGKMGLDATNKWPGETQREWGRPITMEAAVERRVSAAFDDIMKKQVRGSPELTVRPGRQARSELKPCSRETDALRLNGLHAGFRTA